MSSSVRSRIGGLLECQVDQVVADEEQRDRARDEGKPDDGDRGTGQYLRHLTLARPTDEDHAKDGQEDRSDLAGEERDQPVCVDLFRSRGRRQLARHHVERGRGVGRLGPHRLAELYQDHVVSLSEKLTRRYYPVTLCLDIPARISAESTLWSPIEQAAPGATAVPDARRTRRSRPCDGQGVRWIAALPSGWPDCWSPGSESYSCSARYACSGAPAPRPAGPPPRRYPRSPGPSAGWDWRPGSVPSPPPAPCASRPWPAPPWYPRLRAPGCSRPPVR